MIRPEFIYATVAILASLLLFRPRNLALKFCLRLPVVLLAIFMWAYSTADFVLWWGYTGDFPWGFGFFCLPLCVALFLARPWRNAALFLGAFVGITLASIAAYPTVNLQFLVHDIPAYLYMAWTIAVAAAPGVVLAWFIVHGCRHIDAWEAKRKARWKR